MTHEIKPFYIITFHDLQELIGKENFDKYYIWVRDASGNNFMPLDIQINMARCDTVDHVQKFLTEFNIDIELKKVPA